MKLYSWLDVERLLATFTQNFTHFPEGISDIRAFSEAVEIDLINDNTEIVDLFLKTVFGNRWLLNKKQIELVYGSECCIEVEITTDRPNDELKRSIKPLWQDLGYDDLSSTELPELPSAFTGRCKIAGFHSFKGGVGRTTSLLTWLKGLQEQFHNKHGKSRRFKVLLVDADLEAPGLTYLFKASDKPEVSWIQFLEASHYPAVDESTVINYFSEEINRFTKKEAGFEYCLLPAFSENDFSENSHTRMNQLMNISVRPEHLSRTLEQPWRCTDQLQKLGEKLSADLILIDLRAGLSELSSPLLFDPRVERFIVTTLSEQAISGTEFVLKRLSSIANNEEWRRTFASTLDPRVITTFVTDEFRKTDQYLTGLERLHSAYLAGKSTQLNLISATEGLEIIEGEFSSQMLNLGSLESALKVITSDNPLLTEAMNWAKKFTDGGDTEQNTSVEENAADKLHRLCSSLVYAEQGESDKLLLTEPLRNLAQRHINDLPQVVSIGAKGAGKTFNYIQLCRRTTWLAFLEEATIPFNSSLTLQLQNTYLLPHICSKNISDVAQNVVDSARTQFYKKAHQAAFSHFSPSAFEKELNNKLRCQDQDWDDFWEKMITDLHKYEGVTDFLSLNTKLQDSNLQTIVVIDGLEDYFPNADKNTNQSSAIKALLEIPNRLREIRNSRIGIVIFVREDYVEAVISQNHGQFVARYEPYQLVWGADAFLRLVYWTCQQAGLSFADEEVDELTEQQISLKLHELWGVKLGKTTSREAYSVRWVYAALCDLRGRLQARDVIRFLKYSSEKSLSTNNKDQWTDRVLIPQSMRDSMGVCSTEKVEEAKKELVVLSNWVEKLDQLEPDRKIVPFSAKDVKLTPENLSKLIDYGIVYEDKKITFDKRYYLPESYRQGLGFSMSNGGRPKVQAMLKDSLGRLPVDI